MGGLCTVRCPLFYAKGGYDFILAGRGSPSLGLFKAPSVYGRGDVVIIFRLYSWWVTVAEC